MATPDAVPWGSAITTVRVLIIPADVREVCVVTAVRLSSAAFSDAIGGGLLDDALCQSAGGARYTVYLDANRQEKGLRRNGRAVDLVTRLGGSEHFKQFDVRGDVMLVGLNLRGDDVDVPPSVVGAAQACHLLATSQNGCYEGSRVAGCHDGEPDLASSRGMR